MSVLAAAWRIIARRATADWLILTAAMTTIVLATVLLAAGPIYADAVTLSALQRTLADLPSDEANVEIAITIKPAGFAAADEIVAQEVPPTFAPVGGEAFRSIVSESYQLPDQPAGGPVAIAAFHFFEDIEQHATLVAGAWPQASPGRPETALPRSVAESLGLDIGDEIAMTNRRDPTFERNIVVAGVYTIDDRDDPFWFNDPLALEGVTRSASFTTYGPFVTDFATLLGELTPSNAEARWRVFPDYVAVTIDDVPALRRGVEGLEQRLNGEVDTPISFRVATPLASILGDTERSLLVTTSGVLMLSIQLSFLAGLALILTAGLLVESRRVETELLRSRGATNRQMLGVSAIEGAMLTLPAAAAAPWLAVVSLRMVNRFGPLASIGLELDPKPSTSAYLLASLAAIGCTTALAVPAYRSARSFSGSHGARGRQRRTSRTQRAGVDFALVGLAAVGFWQLSVHRESLSTAFQGRFGIDPLLITAPALGLFAGAVLALRVVPLLARTAEAITARVRSPVPALSAWQVARRPVRYARSALLLVMAVGVGFFVAGYASSWSRSQDDQADFEVGSDVRVFPNRRVNDSIADLQLGGAHLAIEAVHSSVPVARGSGGGSDAGSMRRLVMLDAAHADEVVLLRDDLGPGFASAMERLARDRPSLASIPLPGEPRRLAVDFEVAVEPLPEDFVPGDRPSVCFCPSVRAVVQDGDGLLHRVELGAVPVDSGLTRIETDLAATLENGTVALPSYPLSLVDVEIRSPTPLDRERTATIWFGGVYVTDETEGVSWSPATVDLSRESWEIASTSVPGAFRQPSVARESARPGDPIELAVSSGRGSGALELPAYFSIRPTGTALPNTFPVVVTNRLLEATGTAVGDTIRLRGLRIRNDNAEIVGTVEEFPTIDPTSGEAVLIDLSTVQVMGYESGRALPAPDEYWISTGGSPSSDVAEALRGAPYRSLRVIDSATVASRKKTDPVALGTIGLLTVGFIAATVFAAVGFAVSAAVSARERIVEFALLRALGLSKRQLGAWLSLEQSILVVTSLVLGSVVGLLLSWLILPLISLTQEGTFPVPDVIVAYPWTTILWLDIAVLTMLAAIVVAIALLLRRIGLGSLLRLGEN